MLFSCQEQHQQTSRCDKFSAFVLIHYSNTPYDAPFIDGMTSADRANGDATLVLCPATLARGLSSHILGGLEFYAHEDNSCARWVLRLQWIVLWNVFLFCFSADDPVGGKVDAGPPRGYWNFSWVAENYLRFPEDSSSGERDPSSRVPPYMPNMTLKCLLVYSWLWLRPVDDFYNTTIQYKEAFLTYSIVQHYVC